MIEQNCLQAISEHQVIFSQRVQEFDMLDVIVVFFLKRPVLFVRFRNDPNLQNL